MARATTQRNDGVRTGIATAAVALSAVPAPASVGHPTPSGGGPPRVVAVGAGYAASVPIRLTATPGAVGHNVFVVRLRGYDSGKPLTARKVQLAFSLPSQRGDRGDPLTAATS